MTISKVRIRSVSFTSTCPYAQRQREHYSLGPGTYVVFVLGHNAHGPGAWARAEFTVAER